MKSKKPYFITIEGVEGAGKSTAMRFIEKYLTERNIDFILTREPGGTEIAEAIRKVILEHYAEKMCPYTELLLYFASRAQHVSQVIKPALETGKWVISDRFTDASFAYQGIGRGIPEEHIATLETWIQGDLRPDLVLILDVDAKEGITRTKNSRALDRMETESLEFFQRIRKYYLEKAKQHPAKYKVIDAMQSTEKVEQQIIDILNHATK
jgi:dTMP kinase